MPSPAPPLVIARMQSLVRDWEACGDPKCVFLRCYSLMTANVLAALDRREFGDRDWVNRLLHDFAEYYFRALDAYERDPAAAPAVWRLAHDAGDDVAPLQHLLLGVNAHINYDLVFTLADLLEPEWDALSPQQRAARYADHGRVNHIIARTIDAVQDEVLDPVMPSMDFFDALMGPLDEYLIARLITGWREAVWQNATLLLDARARGDAAAVIARVEQDALHLGERIRYGLFPSWTR